VSRGIAVLFLGPQHSRWGWWGSSPRPGLLYPRERPGIHCTVGWVGPRAGLEGGKSRPHRDSIPDCRTRSSVAIPAELPGPLKHKMSVCKRLSPNVLLFYIFFVFDGDTQGMCLKREFCIGYDAMCVYRHCFYYVDAFPMHIAANCSWSFVCCLIILCVSLLPHVYFCTVCVLLSDILQMPDC